MPEKQLSCVHRYFFFTIHATVLSCRLKLEKGTETGIMATIHGFLRSRHGDAENAEESLQYRPPTGNKVVWQ